MDVGKKKREEINMDVPFFAYDSDKSMMPSGHPEE
jgi:hypothetical protein